jgi:hypothetical protein
MYLSLPLFREDHKGGCMDIAFLVRGLDLSRQQSFCLPTRTVEILFFFRCANRIIIER